MARNGSGTYSLPAGNPVTAGTTIQASWANTTLSDIATEITGSLARNGAGGMLAALRNTDGSVTVPSISFNNETTSGFYRASTGNVRFAILGSDVMTLTSSSVSFASNPTLSGGTANGVLYLNGSKVVTTGSGLTFDGTNFATTGTASATKLIPTGGSATGNGMYLPATNTLGFSTNGAEVARLDSSGNLGIGTSSPSSKLDVNGDITQPWAVSMDRFIGSKFSTTYELGLHFVEASRETRIVSKSADSGDKISFYTGVTPTERMRLDTSGNLGLGVTPSATQATYRSMELFGSIWMGGNGTTPATYSMTNTYFDGAYKYKTTGYAATYYGQYSGIHAWYTAPSGTAGDAISFTQAMTLDASGNLFVTTGNSWAPSGAYAAVLGNSGKDAGLTTYYDDSSVKIGAGVSQQTGILIYGQSHANGNYIAFRAGNNERARITSGGDLLVGTTGGGGRIVVEPATGNSIASQVTTAVQYTFVGWNKATSGDNSFVSFGTEASYTARGSIDYNRAGGLTRYNTTSDYRAKDIIGPVQNPGATIDALKVYEGVMKGATQSRPMLIAHEAQEHAPYAVSGVKDEVNEDGTPKFQQMDVSSLVPLLLAEVQSLRARVAALEAA